MEAALLELNKVGVAFHPPSSSSHFDSFPKQQSLSYSKESNGLFFRGSCTCSVSVLTQVTALHFTRIQHQGAWFLARSATLFQSTAKKALLFRKTTCTAATDLTPSGTNIACAALNNNFKREAISENSFSADSIRQSVLIWKSSNVVWNAKPNGSAERRSLEQ